MSEPSSPEETGTTLTKPKEAPPRPDLLPNDLLSDKYTPSPQDIKRVRAGILVGLSEIPGQRSSVDELHKTHKNGLRPSEAQITNAFGSLLKQLQEEGFIEPVVENSDNGETFFGYRLTERGEKEIGGSLKILATLGKFGGR